MAKKAAKRREWSELEAEVLAGLDLAAEFEALGVVFAGDARDDGWRPCHAVDRDDSSPSAACNVQNGQYKDSGGDGLRASLWELAARLKRFATWQEARSEYAKRAGVDMDDPAGPAPSWEANLRIEEWSPALVEMWCSHKKGVLPKAVELAGGKCATYRNRFQVIAVPVVDGKGAACGQIIWEACGGTLPVWDKDGNERQVKMKMVKGSKRGMMLSRDRKSLHENPDAVLLKVEGPTDLLAVESSLSDEQRSKLIAVTNANGSNEIPAADQLEVFRGRVVWTLHDADKAGVAGGKRWAEAIARVAKESRLLILPYEIEKAHGKDLRDWLVEGHDLSDVQKLAETAEIIAPPATPEGPTETEDSPHRLAQAFAAAHERLVYWQNGWHEYTGYAYRVVPDKDLDARITAWIHREFVRLHLATRAAGGEAESVRHVPTALVSNVCNALRGLCVLPSTQDPPCWLDGSRKVGSMGCLSLSNGILDLDGMFAGAAENQCLLPHTSEFFTMQGLACEFSTADNPCPLWMKFLGRNLEGDVERIHRLQEWFGYCLTRDTSFQKFLVMEGEGANGKSVVCGVLGALLGHANCSSVPLERFDDQFSLAMTVGKLANIAAEIGEIEKAAEGILKGFVAGDFMAFDRKFKEPLRAKPTAKLIFATNNRPRFNDRSSGLWRRMDLFPMRVQIPPAERVRGMDTHEFWVNSGELPGILTWAIQGLARLHKQGGFTDSVVCREALEDYRADTNPCSVFIQDRLHVEPGGRAEAGEVFQAYRDWCKGEGLKPCDARFLGKELRRLIPSTKKSRLRQGRILRWYYEGFSIVEVENE